MRKYLIIILLSSLFIPAYSQKIVFDKVDANGVRRVETLMKRFSHWTDETETSIGLEAKDRYGEISYRLCIKFKCKNKIRIDNYMRLLLKSRKGDIVEVKCSHGGKDEKGEMYDPASAERHYEVKVYYDIGINEISLIKEKGLERMRAEMYDRDINLEFNESRDAGRYIVNAYNKLNKRIRERRDFSDGF